MAFWITLFRSLFAIALGVALFIQPDKARPLLVNFMGGYWLASGLLSVRWGIAQQGSKRLALLVGIVGVLAGLATLTRNLATNVIAEDIVLSGLGVIIMLTGVLHVSGRLKTRQTRLQQRNRTGMILGIFEIILGLTLIISPLEKGPLVYWSAFIWAIVGGVILMGDALHMRRTAHQEEGTV